MQHLPEETQQAQAVFERGLCRENHREMQLDHESSRGKQITAEDSVSWLLKKTVFSIFIAFHKLICIKHR